MRIATTTAVMVARETSGSQHPAALTAVRASTVRPPCKTLRSSLAPTVLAPMATVQAVTVIAIPIRQTVARKTSGKYPIVEQIVLLSTATIRFNMRQEKIVLTGLAITPHAAAANGETAMRMSPTAAKKTSGRILTVGPTAQMA